MHCVQIFVFIMIRGWMLGAQGKSLVTFPEESVDTSSINESSSETPPCTIQPLDIDDVEFKGRDYMFVKSYNATVHATSSDLEVGDSRVCFNRTAELKAQILKKCTKWSYKAEEFRKLENGSVELYDEILEPGTFRIEDGNLLTCATEDNDYDVTYKRPETKEEKASIYIGQIGSSISILALTAHLITFCLVPSLRNLPGYNLASLSVAFLFGYSFHLIGQIPEVLGLSCVISGVLQVNFFLVAFFCMNVMAVDIWRTLRLATQKLVVHTDSVKRRQFICYTIYSWGAPLLITTTSVLMDNLKGVPDWLRPEFGRHDTCWMNNNLAKTIYFSIPAFSLFVVNGIFFVMSAFIIKNNTMGNTSDQQGQTARINFVLYVRLGIMMGVTWLLGVLAAAVGDPIFWMVFDALNSLQGLFVFLLFTCSRKVINRIREKLGSRPANVTSGEKQTSSGTKSDNTGPSVR